MSEHSPTPGTPQTPYKAYAATALAFVASFVTYWVADADPFTSKEIGEGLIAAAVSAGVLGGATFAVKNAAK